MKFIKYFWMVWFFGSLSIGLAEEVKDLKEVKVIYIFGPSCGGKSTLGMALKESLGDQWTYVDRDKLIEQNCKNEQEENDLNVCLEEKIRSLKEKVIVDAQKPWREKKQDELYILVLAPLNVLLERDAERVRNWTSSKPRSKWATDYVIKTHQIFENMKKEQFDYQFDSSRVSVQEEVNLIKNRLENLSLG